MLGACPRCSALVQCVLKSINKQCSPLKSSKMLLKRSGTECSFNFSAWKYRHHVTVAGDDAEPEEFGKIAERKGVSVFKLPTELRLPKEEDEDEKPRPKFFSKYSPHWYFLRCKRLAKEKKTKECLQFFEEKMLKEDGVFPEEQNYTVVIGALARDRQVSKAFQLYRQMRDRGIQPSMATYTALFNAVAENPDSKELRRATALYAKLHKNKIRMNRITYNSLIKVFGRHGTTEQMMGIFRESITVGFEPDSETFNMILLSLLKDKEAGFRKAIEVWRQMVMLDVKPDGKSIIYLLKVLKNCGIGDPNVAYRKLIQDVPDPSQYKDYFKKHIRNIYWLKGQESKPRMKQIEQSPPEPEMLTLEPGILETDIDEESKYFQNSVTEDAKNNPLDSGNNNSAVRERVSDSMVSLSPAQTKKTLNLLQLPLTKAGSHLPVQIQTCTLPSHRLQLIGGHKHILDMFEKHDIKPTVMVLSSLAQVLPRSLRAENELITFGEKNSLKFDADFFNLILRRRVARNDQYSVKEILNKMVSVGLSPNYRTWCVSALSCIRGHQGVNLVNEALNANVDLDHIFFNSMISAALRGKTIRIKGYKDVWGLDYRYLSRILLKMEDLKIKADRHMISLLESASDWPEGYERWKLADTEFEKQVFKFRNHYNDWLNTTEVLTEKKI